MGDNRHRDRSRHVRTLEGPDSRPALFMDEGSGTSASLADIGPRGARTDRSGRLQTFVLGELLFESSRCRLSPLM
jgi:hypothetical protein